MAWNAITSYCAWKDKFWKFLIHCWHLHTKLVSTSAGSESSQMLKSLPQKPFNNVNYTNNLRSRKFDIQLIISFDCLWIRFHSPLIPGFSKSLLTFYFLSLRPILPFIPFIASHWNPSSHFSHNLCRPTSLWDIYLRYKQDRIRKVGSIILHYKNRAVNGW